MGNPLGRWHATVKEAGQVARYRIGAAFCRYFGHSHDMETHDFVAGEYREVPDDGLDHGPPKLVDIDGGGVEWHCPRCGQGGRNWF